MAYVGLYSCHDGALQARVKPPVLHQTRVSQFERWFFYLRHLLNLRGDFQHSITVLASARGQTKVRAKICQTGLKRCAVCGGGETLRLRANVKCPT